MGKRECLGGSKLNGRARIVLSLIIALKFGISGKFSARSKKEFAIPALIIPRKKFGPVIAKSLIAIARVSTLVISV